MALTETPQIPEGSEGGNNIFHRIWKGVQSVGSGITSLFREDPEARKTINELLTDQFVEDFYGEFFRMVQEDRDGAEGLVRGLKVNGWGHEEDMFDVVFREVVPKRLKNLPQPYYSEMMTKLRQRCGLT